MKKLLILITLMGSQLSMAQISNLNMNGVPARLSAYSGVEGSPYLFQDWAKADIGTTNAGLKEDVAYRFNVHDNELEVVNSYAPSPGKMFVFEENFYLIDFDENVQSVRNNTRNILKALREEDQDIGKKIVKENNLNLGREDHLTIFFQKLNEL